MTKLLLTLLLAAAPSFAAGVPDLNNFEIHGSTAFAAKTREALALLAGSTTFMEAAPYIAVIEESKHSGMLAYAKKPTFQVGGRTWNAGAAWYAGTIAHDGYHSLLYHRAKTSRLRKPPDEAWKGKLAEQKCLLFQERVLTEIKAGKNQVDFVRSLLANPTYQNIPYAQRDW
jgi:hypothetical protein